MQIPREYGGEGRPISTAYRIVREFARTDGSLAHLFAYHIQQLNKVVTSGSREQQARLFTETAKNNLFWGNTGTSFQRTLTARRDGDDYVLNGYRTFSSGSRVADYISVVWDEDGRSDRISAFLPTTREGLAILDDWDGLGQRQTGSGTVTFTDVPGPQGRDPREPGDGGNTFSTLIALLAQSAPDEHLHRQRPGRTDRGPRLHGRTQPPLPGFRRRESDGRSLDTARLW